MLEAFLLSWLLSLNQAGDSPVPQQPYQARAVEPSPQEQLRQAASERRKAELARRRQLVSQRRASLGRSSRPYGRLTPVGYQLPDRQVAAAYALHRVAVSQFYGLPSVQRSSCHSSRRSAYRYDR